MITRVAINLDNNIVEYMDSVCGGFSGRSAFIKGLICQHAQQNPPQQYVEPEIAYPEQEVYNTTPRLRCKFQKEFEDMISAKSTNLKRFGQNVACKVCKMTLLENIGCKPSIFMTRNKREYSPVKFGDERLSYPDLPFCPDCVCSFGQYHHKNCDLEECPVCYRPLRMCTCTAARFYDET